jgi:hypothetical protein
MPGEPQWMAAALPAALAFVWIVAMASHTALSVGSREGA